MSLIGILVNLIIIGIILWLIWYLVDLLPIPAQFKQAVKIIVIAIGIIYLILLLAGFLPPTYVRIGID